MNKFRNNLAALAAMAWLLASAGAAPDTKADNDKSALRKQALELNEITGTDPMAGKIRTLAEKPEDAKKLLAAALAMTKEKDKAQPFNFNAAYILARTAHIVKELETSQAFYRICMEQALKLQSGMKMSQAYDGLISLFYQQKKYAEAEKLCKEFLEVESEDNVVARMKLVVFERMLQALAKQDKYDEANKLLDPRIKAQPTNWFLQEFKGGLEYERGNSEAAAKAYEAALDIINKNKELEQKDKEQLAARPRYLLSGVYVDLNKVEKAAEHLEALLKMEPDNPTYNNDLGYIWADHDMKLDEAEKLIRKALEEDKKQRQEAGLTGDDDKDNGAYLDSMGWVLFKQKKYKEAKKYLLDAIKDKDSQHAEIYDHLADVHMALGEKSDAVAAWKKAIEIAGPSKREKQKKVEVEKKLKMHENPND
jgi:tetratricopeptide (TPR) repeat protein